MEYAGSAPLTAGTALTWEVTASVAGKPTAVCQGMFHTASQEQRDTAEAWAKLLAQPEPAHLALAAMWYRENGLVREAIAVNQQLARQTADPAVYCELKELYLQIHDQQQAGAAEKTMTELQPKQDRLGIVGFRGAKADIQPRDEVPGMRSAATGSTVATAMEPRAGDSARWHCVAR